MKTKLRWGKEMNLGIKSMKNEWCHFLPIDRTIS